MPSTGNQEWLPSFGRAHDSTICVGGFGDTEVCTSDTHTHTHTHTHIQFIAHVTYKSSSAYNVYTLTYVYTQTHIHMVDLYREFIHPHK